MKRVLGYLLVVLVTVAMASAQPAAEAATLEWTAYPANASISGSENGGHPVRATYGWTRTDEQGPIKVHGRLLDGQLDITVSGTNTDGTQWSIEASGAPEMWARPRVHPTERVPDSAGQMTFEIQWSDSYTCNRAPGWLDLLDIGFGPDGRVTRLWYRYFHGCDEPKALMTGEVRFGYPEPPTEPSPSSAQFQKTQPAGTSPAVAVHVRGPAGATVGAARISGTERGSFVIRKDDCSGTLSASGCLVSVAMRPIGSSFRRATLEIPVGSTVVKVPLEGLSLPGKYRHTFASEDESVTGWATSGDHDPSSASIQANRWSWFYDNEALDLESTVDGVGIGLDIYSPEGQMFTPGTFATADPAHDDKDYLEATYQTPGAGYGCGIPNDRATWTIHQVVRGPAVEPAYDVEYDHWCGARPDADLRGRFQYGARADVVDPARASQLRVSSGVLSWVDAADVVRTEVRARAGGVSIPSSEYGDLICSTTGTSCRIPASYSDGSLALAVFTFDAAGNVAAPATYIRKGATSIGIYKGTSTLSGRVTDAARAYRLTGRTVTLQSRRPGGTWSTVKTARTDGTGRYAFSMSPSSTREFRVSISTSTTHLSATSRTFKWM